LGAAFLARGLGVSGAVLSVLAALTISDYILSIVRAFYIDLPI